MKQEQRLLDLVYEIHRFLANMESEPRDYGTGDLLYASEIHTIAAIAERPLCNLTQLAAALQVSKAAASKFVKKIQLSGYITKEVSPYNRRQLIFSLTEKGRLAVDGHSRFEKRVFAPFIKTQASLKQSEEKVIRLFLENLIAASKNG